MLKTAALLALILISIPLFAQDPAPSPTSPATPDVPAPPGSNYNKAMFLKPIPADQLDWLKQFDGVPTKTLMHDKQFRKMMHDAIPNCEFHYGRDMPLSDALDSVMENSKEPVLIRDGRYLSLAGSAKDLIWRARDFSGSICAMGLCWGRSTFIRRMVSRRRR